MEAVGAGNVSEDAGNVTINIVLQHYSIEQLVALRISTLLLAFTGLTGNLLVVLVILSRRRWRFANSMFVLNIAVANLFICAFTLPLMTRALFDINWSPATQFCQLSGFLDNTAFACSAWSLALGSIERFFLVVFPIRHRQVMKYQKAVLLSLITWIFSVILSIMPILGWNSYRYSPLTFTCGIDTNKSGVHLYYFLVYLTFVLPGPLIISTVCYSYILFYLRVHRVITCKMFAKRQNCEQQTHRQESTDIFGINRSSSEQHEDSNVTSVSQDKPMLSVCRSSNIMADLWKSPKHRSKNIKVVLPMILISVAFLFCFIPTVIIGFDITINPGPENGQPRLQMIEYFVINLLLLGNSAMNPIIFTMCSSKFRKSVGSVVTLLFQRLFFVLFYLIYMVYYSIVTLFKIIRTSCPKACLKRHVKRYDSLNDVVIKITLTNSYQDNIPDTPDEALFKQTNLNNKCDNLVCYLDNKEQYCYMKPGVRRNLIDDDINKQNTEIPDNIKQREQELKSGNRTTKDNRTSETLL